MRTFIATIAIILAASTAYAADEKRQVFGVASDQAIEILKYGDRPASLKVTYTGIEKVADFEGCEIQDFIMETKLVCGDESFTLNASSIVGDCEYRGLHRGGGLGFSRKATWEAWFQVARACGASEERVAELEGHKTSWAAEDGDKRF